MDLAMEPEDIEFLEQRLNYTFKDKNLLIQALTRKAFAQEQKQRGQNCKDQEIYRILGDAILKASLVEMLIQQGYDSRESITNKKMELEKRESLGRMFEELGLAKFIRLGAGERKQGIQSQASVLGETFEALIAAIHIDTGNYEKTREIIINLFDKPVPEKFINQTSTQSQHLDEIGKTWLQFHMCDTCFQSDVCAAMRMCYFDATGDD